MKLQFSNSIELLIKQFKKSAIEVGENMNYTVRDSRIGQDIFTRSANSCTITAVQAGDETLIGHFDPQYFNIHNFQEIFMSKVKALQDKFGEAQAIVTGGWENGRIDPLCKTPSGLVGSTVAGELDKTGMPLSFIFGKKEGVTTFDHLFATRGKITLSNELIEKELLNLPEDKIQKLLEKIYEFVEIDSKML
ncbi:MAG: hypothetical protein NC408_02525 [Candidatus Gastranaerophilales bacterium]|nr:hypothetical protein [Candidatus Gastranaerophilales bacterium]MCM1073539.1 hypothetical protein [Bacteroides sp.]